MPWSSCAPSERKDEERHQWERWVEPERPTFDVDPPMKQFFVELTLDHLYWHSFKIQLAAPTFDRDALSVNGLLRGLKICLSSSMPCPRT